MNPERLQDHLAATLPQEIPVAWNTGKRYLTEVPDTLDLADDAALTLPSLHAALPVHANPRM